MKVLAGTEEAVTVADMMAVEAQLVGMMVAVFLEVVARVAAARVGDEMVVAARGRVEWVARREAATTGWVAVGKVRVKVDWGSGNWARVAGASVAMEVAVRAEQLVVARRVVAGVHRVAAVMAAAVG